jgi:hypothetical protein
MYDRPGANSPNSVLKASDLLIASFALLCFDFRSLNGNSSNNSLRFPGQPMRRVL